jgi:transcriptional regulator with XRE-family HTH domain
VTADDAARRAELGGFLRARRGQVDRADFGLPPIARSRARGLRREEVAYLSGVSVTWYTWLEQGREINPSRQVLDAVARNLRLTPAEHGYVLGLAGYSFRAAPAVPDAQAAPDHLRHLLEALDAAPAFAVGGDWSIAAWNRAYEALYPGVASVPPADRNLLWLVFTDPYVRKMLPNWERDSRHFLAEFRAESGARLGEPGHTALVERLKLASPEFLREWRDHTVAGFTSRERLFHHPAIGDLTFEHHRLTPSDDPSLHVVIYTPLAGTPTAERIARLLSLS